MVWLPQKDKSTRWINVFDSVSDDAIQAEFDRLERQRAFEQRKQVQWSKNLEWAIKRLSDSEMLSALEQALSAQQQPQSFRKRKTTSQSTAGTKRFRPAEQRVWWAQLKAREKRKFIPYSQSTQARKKPRFNEEWEPSPEDYIPYIPPEERTARSSNPIEDAYLLGKEAAKYEKFREFLKQ